MSKPSERRERVSALLIKGISETQIAQELGVSRQTIVRDVAFLKMSAQNWLEGLAHGGFIFEYRLSLEKIRCYGMELQKIFDKTEDDWLKFNTLRELQQNVRLYLELLGETPTIEALKKAMRMNIEDVSKT